MKKSAQVVSCVFILISSATCQAEFSPHNLPGMGDLVMFIDQADRSRVEEEIYDTYGRVSADIPVADTAQGRTASELAGLLSGSSETLRQKLIDAFLESRSQLLKNLSDNNYAVDDMGVACAVSFILLWELASHRELSQAASLQAAKLLVHSFHNLEVEYARISDEEKAKAYDWLITTPVALASLVAAYEYRGREKEVKMLREKSASLFLSVFKIPREMLKISESGVISVDIDRVLTYQQELSSNITW